MLTILGAGLLVLGSLMSGGSGLAAGDQDKDGCTDEQELQPKSLAAIGGGRDPNYYWDFMAMWVANQKDRRVDIIDIGAIVQRFGATDADGVADPNRNIDPLDPPQALTGYHPSADRSPPGPNILNAGTPDGTINIIEIGLAVVQFGHTCVGSSPLIGQIGDKLAPLGSTLTFTVLASDPDNDAITLDVAPLPLPSNSSFEPATGEFSFTPVASQVGSFDLTFTATDKGGFVAQPETIKITVEEADPDGITTLQGEVLTTDSAALPGVRLSLGPEGSASAQALTPSLGGGTVGCLPSADPLVVCSDVNGEFFFGDVPSGQQRLLIDGGTASSVGCPDEPPLQDLVCYATVPEVISLIEGANNELGAPIFLLPLDVASADPVTSDLGEDGFELGTCMDGIDNGGDGLTDGEDPDCVSVVDSSPVLLPATCKDGIDNDGDGLTDSEDPDCASMMGETLPPITLTVPVGRARDAETGNLFEGDVSISPVPDPVLSPQPWPDEIVPSLYFALQPLGVLYDPPVPISFPNVEAFPAGSFVEIHALIHDTGAMEKIGEAVVSSDGMLIESVGGVVRNNSWHGVVAPPPQERESNATTDPSGPSPTRDCVGSSVCLKSGDLSVGHDLVSYRSMGVSRSLRLEYHSTTAAPAPVVSMVATPGNRVPPPETISTTLEVGGVMQDSEIFYDAPAFCTAVSCPLGVFSRTFDASLFDTGIYPTTLSMSCNFPIGLRIERQSQNVVVVNQRNSPYGVGWNVRGLQRIYRTATGDLLVTDGDDSPLIFTPASRAEAQIGVSGERDFYHFAASAGEIVSVRLNRRSNLADGSGTLDPVVELRNSSGILLARDADSGTSVPGGPGGNALISTFQLPATDTYTLVALGKGGTRGPYDLLLTTARDTQLAGGHINPPRPIEPSFVFNGDISAVPEAAVPQFEFQGEIASPAELDTFTFPGNAGTVASIQVSRVGNNPDGSGTVDPKVELRDSQGFLLAQDDNTGPNVPPGPGGNALILNFALPATDTYTIGVTGAQGTIGPYEVEVFFGNLTVETETDSFDFAADAGTTVNISVERVANNPNGSATLDPVVELRDSQGVLIARDDDGGTNQPPGPGRNALIVRFTLPATDTYSVNVIGGNATVGPYTMEITFGDVPSDVEVEGGGPVTVSATVVSPPGEFSKLRINVDGTFTRTMKNGTSIVFDMDGFQTSVTDRNGNTTTYTYDEDRLTSVMDPVGQKTTLTYVNGLLNDIQAAGRKTTFEHDAQGNLVRIIDPDDAQTSYAYDARHLLTSQTSPRGALTPDPGDFTTFYQYDDVSGHFLQSTLPDGSTRGVSDTQGVGLVDPDHDGTELDPRDLVPQSTVGASFTDGKGQTTSYQADSLGNLTLITDPLGRQTDIERDPNGLATEIERPNGAVTRLKYDDRGNLTASTEDAISATTTFTYEPAFNQVEAITDPKGNTTNINFDGNGNPVEIIDALGTITQLAYDDPARNPSPAAGLLTSVTGAFGIAGLESTTLFEYDTLGRLVETTDPLTHVTTLAYDSAGNVTQSCDALGRITRFDYDNANRLVKVRDATTTSVDFACPVVSDPAPPCPGQGVSEPGVTCYEYDANGNLTSVIDARGSQTKFVHDSKDRLAESIDPLLSKDVFEYDGNGNLILATDRKGQRLVFEYDDVNRLEQKILPGSLITSYGYDDFFTDDVTSVVDPDSSLTMTYDDVGRLETVSTAGSPNQPDVTISYTQDKNGNRLTSTDPEGTTRYEYDSLNRLTKLVDRTNVAPNATCDDLGVICFQYDALSRRTELALPNGATTTYAYDDASRLLCMVNQLTAGSTRCTQPTPVCEDLLGLDPISCFAYGYDDVGNRTSLSQERSAISVTSFLTYAYDDLYRLTQATNPLPSLPDETFDLDPVGNRLRRDGKTEDATYDAANRLDGDQQFCYEHDANGNQTQKRAKVAGACTGEITTYTYDAEDQLTQIDLPGPVVSEYRYDGLGRRIEKDVDGAIIRYVYDNEDLLLEYDGTNTLQGRYTHGPGVDEPLIMERDLDKSSTFESETERFFYHTDGLGSITELTDDAGAVRQAYVYDSFGRIVRVFCDPSTFTGFETARAALGDPGMCLTSPYTYTGREVDLESGLYFYRARYYDPQIGRFLQEDPVGLFGGSNLYAYVKNNPIKSVDPSGLEDNLFTRFVKNFARGFADQGTGPVPTAAVEVAGPTFEAAAEAGARRNQNDLATDDIFENAARIQEIEEAKARGRPLDPFLEESAEPPAAGSEPCP